MEVKNVVSGFVVFALLLTICLSQGSRNLQNKTTEEKGRKSLIRKDLLVRKGESVLVPKRNIFSSQTSSRSEFGPDLAQVRKNFENVEASSKDEVPQVFFGLKYIGYIDSPQKIVALVIFGGQALAVEEGEILEEGMRVGKITPEEIEIIGRDSVPRKFSRQGEKE